MDDTSVLVIDSGGNKVAEAVDHATAKDIARKLANKNNSKYYIAKLTWCCTPKNAVDEFNL